MGLSFAKNLFAQFCYMLSWWLSWQLAVDLAFGFVVRILTCCFCCGRGCFGQQRSVHGNPGNPGATSGTNGGRWVLVSIPPKVDTTLTVHGLEHTTHTHRFEFFIPNVSTITKYSILFFTWGLGLAVVLWPCIHLFREVRKYLRP